MVLPLWVRLLGVLQTPLFNFQVMQPSDQPRA
jgi:hypothetical protein